MQRVYTDSDPLIVGHLAEVLRGRGIVCMVRNYYLGGGVGDLPPTEVWPQLWVERDEDEAVARRLIDEVLSNHDSDGPAWVCPGCGERVEGQFAACWRCGSPAP
ncbi:hypothetical protein KBTX_03511 [wastewater metagenome]|uniref:DUF2007 domain-containing protein n=2 Tax=unclassified sequences TaxID=12908 RepID=A0A5B8RF16_9ZZZZ|nr:MULTISPECIES: DUF2007 domain-containing protein [Arhodomonas]MCS4503496.1 DUF2007 domain-containing protein [Arhodomonas aquaeolei]QEA07166.1 hypothetical protein KBTEX_03511 [uncultured organism]